MIVGVPKEIKANELRVGITPEGVSELVPDGHTVLIEGNAGRAAGFNDEAYRERGGFICRRDEVWERAGLIVKVKEPLPEEYPFLKKDQALFTFLHLAALPELTRVLLEKKVTAIAYETVTDEKGNLPLLKPMSEIAGALSIQAGAKGLETVTGGRGVLLPGLPGVKPATATIIGAGVSGTMAARIATGIGADVTVLDIVAEKLEKVRDITQQKAKTAISSRDTLAAELAQADLIILTVLTPGASAPVIITKEMLGAMKPGACIVDISIDQGGAAESSRPTTHAAPYFLEDGIVHYCVANMPSAVPLTSTRSLTSMTLPYVRRLLSMGTITCLRKDPHLRNGLNTHGGYVTCPGVAESLSYEHVPPEQIL